MPDIQTNNPHSLHLIDNDYNQLALNIINSTNEAIIVVDNDYRIILMNPAAQTLTGLSARRGAKIKIQTVFNKHQDISHLIDTAMTEGRSISNRETIHLDRQHGSSLPVRASASPLYSDSGSQRGAILTLHDASNLYQLEQEVQRADRLGMLDTLAAGLAHEVKNPLGGIRGAAQLLSMELDHRHDLLEYTHIMIKETDRINGIIEELMNLTTPRSKVLSDVDLTQIISDIILLQKQCSKKQDGKDQGNSRQAIKFNRQFDPSIPAILGDQALLTRLFLNLIKNAVEAISNSGCITVSTRIDTEHHLTRPGQTSSPFVVIKIIDDGPGINAEVLENIFTPFFTTKSNGSGLGLAISQKIINDHDGLLRIDSTAGHGTCCSIYLPLKRS